MAIPATNIDLSADVAYQIYGNIPVSSKSLCQALCSTDISVPNSLLDFANCSASLSRSPSSASWSTPGNCVITITAKSAWCMTITQTPSPPIWSINASGTNGKVTLCGTSGINAVYGGSGSISINRNTTSCSSTSGTLTICYSNGAGGRISTTVSLYTTY